MRALSSRTTHAGDLVAGSPARPDSPLDTTAHSRRSDLDEPAAFARIVMGVRHDGVPLRTTKVAAAGLDGSGHQIPELGLQGA